jgi:Transposase IS4
MSDPNNRPSKKAKLSHTPKPLEKPYSQCKPIAAIPPPPNYDPLPHRDNYRPPTIELPPHSNIDLYSLFTLFLTETHFETIATNTNRYAESKGAGIVGKCIWKPTCAAEIKVIIAIFIYIGVVRL